jgi:serine protease inhibitor
MKASFAALTALLFAMPATDSASLIRGNTAFAIDLYRLQASGKDNIFFSPYSISTAMAMVAAGARGTTASEIEKAMRFPFGGAKLTRSWSEVQQDVNKKRADVTLLTANALWAAKDVEFKSDYLSQSRKDFAAKLETLDFAKSEAARKRINDWVSDTTQKKIPQLIGSGMLNASTRLVLTNAIYMKAPWLNEFPKARTNDNGVFHAAAGDQKAALMRNLNDFRYAHIDGVRVIELPYKGSELSMLVVLPDANDALGTVEKTFSVQKLAEWDKALASAKVDVTFPRFTSDISLDLNGPLTTMGMRQAFSAHADFSGIAKEKLMISDVIHRARIDVAEEGTEAAAATAVIMTRATAVQPRPKPEIFNADHPFLYLIRRTDTKSVLFIGRLVQPD